MLSLDSPSVLFGGDGLWILDKHRSLCYKLVKINSADLTVSLRALNKCS